MCVQNFLWQYFHKHVSPFNNSENPYLYHIKPWVGQSCSNSTCSSVSLWLKFYAFPVSPVYSVSDMCICNGGCLKSWEVCPHTETMAGYFPVTWNTKERILGQSQVSWHLLLDYYKLSALKIIWDLPNDCQDHWHSPNKSLEHLLYEPYFQHSQNPRLIKPLSLHFPLPPSTF